MLARILFTNSRYTTLVILVILMVGLASLRSIGRQEDPSMTNFVATVTTFFPGAEPSRVEALVSRPLEDEIRKISEVDEITSISSGGVSAITIELDDHLPGPQLERLWSEVRDAIGDAQRDFPTGVAAPVFDNDRMVDYARIVTLRPAEGVELPAAILKRVAEDFADKARNHPGTMLVELFGEPEEEIRVAVDEQALIARGLSMAEVTRALRDSDPKLAAGRVNGRSANLMIEVAGDFDSIERIRQVIIRADSSGRSVRIADIAQVFKDEVTPPKSLALVRGRPGILMGIAMREGLQVDTWSRSFDDLVEHYQQTLPAGILLETSYDQSLYTIERLTAVSKNMVAGILLVILVLLFTLGWRAALIVAVTLPLCSLMSVSVLYYMGVPIHQMSVTGLIVALGLLVDGAIVMTDEIRKSLLKGRSQLQAISESVQRLRVPLLSSTATTVLAFMPMILLPGPSGDFLGSIAKAVVVMLCSSMILALILTPALAAWLLPRGLTDADRHWWNQGMDSGRLGQAFKQALGWALRHPAGSICLALVLPITGFLAFPTLTAQFFPGTDRDQFYIQVKLPDGRSIGDTLELARAIDADLAVESLVRRVDWSVGESAPPFYYNMIRMREGIPTWAEALVLTHDEKRTDALIRRLQGELDQRYPQARVVVRGIIQGPPVSAPIEVDLSGPNLQVLRELGEEFRLRLEGLDNITHTNTSLVAGAPKLVFNLDEEKLRLLNMHLSDVATALDTSLQGRTGGEVLEDTERLPVRARLAETQWSSTEQIANLRLPLGASQAGRAQQLQGVALSTLGGYELQPASSPITRKNGVRTNTVQGFVVRGVLAEGVLKQLKSELAANPIELPQGYKYTFGGDSEERSSVINDIMAPFGLILAMLIATVVLTFNSWRLSAVAFGVCVSSVGLSLLSLAIFQYPFGIQALIGVIGSIGVSINAAIIIMTALQLDEGAMRGNIFATRNVVMDSSRHIVSTTVTTFGGFLPLILAGGGFWPPFAMAIAGGVLLSTIVSFFLVPPLFLVLRPGRKPTRSQLALAPARTPEPAERLAS
jgi:multidrug efflux pump subunit AcrB